MTRLRHLLSGLLLLCALDACRSRPISIDKSIDPLPDVRGPVSYVVRGEIVQLPAGPGRELVIRHEAIPDFVNQSGVKVGMESMMMPFAVEPGARLDGLAVGDKVSFVLDVDWAQPSFSVGKIEKLPGDTKLRFASVDAR